MARDRLGFEAGRKRDKQGRPLKLCTPPPTDAYRENWDRIFGKKVSSVEEVMENLPEVGTRKGMMIHG